MSEERNRSKWGIRARVASGQSVEDDNVGLRNLVEQLVGIVHGGGVKIEYAEVDELCEDRDVILEMSFDGEGLDLLELRERSALGYEREGSVCIGFGFGVRKGAYLKRWGCHAKCLQKSFRRSLERMKEGG